MDVRDMTLEVVLVANGVFPESRLPQGVFTTRVLGNREAFSNESPGKLAFDGAPSVAVVVITRRQGPHRMKVVGKNHNGVDGKGLPGPNFCKRLPQGCDVVDEVRGAAILKGSGKKIGSARRAVATIAHHCDSPFIHEMGKS